MAVFKKCLFNKIISDSGFSIMQDWHFIHYREGRKKLSCSGERLIDFNYTKLLTRSKTLFTLSTTLILT
jgi:hypothetical protein